MSCADVREDGAIRVPRVKGSEVPGEPAFPPGRALFDWKEDDEALWSARYDFFLKVLPTAESLRKQAARVAVLSAENGGGK